MQQDADLGEDYTTEYRLDAGIGRWFSTDPLVYDDESPYSFVSNDPVDMVDPMGLYPTKETAENFRQKAIDVGLKDISEVKQWENGEFYFGASVCDEGTACEMTSFTHLTDFSEYENQGLDPAQKESDITSKGLGNSGKSIDLFESMRDGSLFGLSNGIVRENYNTKVGYLRFLYDNNWQNNPNNHIGLLKRHAYKLQARNMSIAGADQMLEIFEPMKEKSLLNKKGNVTRFYMTRGGATFKWINRGFTGLAAVGVITSGIRIAKSEDKIREAKIVAGGMVGAYFAMEIGAPIAGSIGAASSAFITPVGGLIFGAVIELGFGIMGGIGGEYIAKSIVDSK